MEIILITLVLTTIILCSVFVIKSNEKAEKYKFLVDNTNDIIYLFDAKENNKLLYISKSVEKFCGYNQQDFYADNELFIKITHPDDYPLLEFVREYPQAATKPVVMRWIKKEGTVIWIEQTLSILKNKIGKVIGFEGVVKNISHQKKEELSIRDTSKVFKELFHNTTDCIFLYKYTKDCVAGEILVVNDYSASLLECSNEDILNHSFSTLLDKDILNKTEEALKQLPETGKLRYETELISKSRQRVPVEINSNITNYRNQKVILAIARNVTIRKKMEKELLKSQKLESIGILAGGLAHDFNNYLSVILGNVNLALNYMDNTHKIEEILKETEKAILKATGLTHQLLTFSKGGMPIKKTASISDVLKETAIFDLRGVNIDCKFAIPPDLWPVEFDVGQINQVFNNLIINARQAMPDGGKLDIKVENILLKDNEVPLLKDGRYIKISLKDNGIGIPADNCSKIFDPFFTTKENGSGLGLALSYSIIKKHAGHMIVESKLGEGTTFFLYLPASEKKVMKEKKETGGVKKGQERVLVMDDQIMIMNTLGKMLTFLGYKPTLTSCGEEAVKVYKIALEENNPFDLVLMDLTVQGGMGGDEAVRKMLEIDPHVCAIVSSGYSTHPIMADYTNYGFQNVICKPYTIKNLSEVISETIAKNKKKRIAISK